MEQQQVNKENKLVEELAKEIISNVLYSITGGKGHPAFTTDKCDEIAEFIFKDLNSEKLFAASSKGKEEDAVEIAEWLGEQVLEYDKGNWFTPNMEKSSINNSYRVTYENPVTTKQLYSLFKQSKETTG